MRVRFLDAAQRELDDAVAWYNQREAGLGWEFLTSSIGLFGCCNCSNWLTI
jgi:hypothetical protein